MIRWLFRTFVLLVVALAVAAGLAYWYVQRRRRSARARRADAARVGGRAAAAPPGHSRRRSAQRRIRCRRTPTTSARAWNTSRITAPCATETAAPATRRSAAACIRNRPSFATRGPSRSPTASCSPSSRTAFASRGCPPSANRWRARRTGLVAARAVHPASSEDDREGTGRDGEVESAPASGSAGQGKPRQSAAHAYTQRRERLDFRK